jgi:hypothetical protein
MALSRGLGGSMKHWILEAWKLRKYSVNPLVATAAQKPLDT